ncbi:THO complex subunit 6 homolog [Branchiostoma floridae x Branchiostoma belcheri]
MRHNMADNFETEMLSQRRQLYTTVFSQSFSPCGRFVAVCDNFGRITLFSLAASLSADAKEDSRKPVFTFQAHNGPVYSLSSTERFLISAGTGDIKAWSWPDILKKSPKVQWSLSPPFNHSFDNPETNSVVITKDGTLCSGCGDNNVYLWDMQTGTCTSTLKGHTDYIHALTLRSNDQQLVSAGEDGAIRIWDLQDSREAAHVLEPYKHDVCARPEQGRWIGCVAVDSGDDWLVCGGGPSLSLWHMRSMTPVVAFSSPDSCQNVVMFQEDQIMSAGSSPCVNHWSMNGELRSQVPCTPPCIYSLAINTNSASYKVLSAAGSSAKVDIFTNFGYKAFSMLVC